MQRLDLTNLSPDSILNTAEASILLGVSPSTLARWRCQGKATPPYIIVGTRAVRYRWGDLKGYLENNSTAQQG